MPLQQQASYPRFSSPQAYTIERQKCLELQLRACPGILLRLSSATGNVAVTAGASQSEDEALDLDPTRPLVSYRRAPLNACMTHLCTNLPTTQMLCTSDVALVQGPSTSATQGSNSILPLLL